jgi:DNA-binding transcriptional ArsR family regulator
MSAADPPGLAPDSAAQVFAALGDPTRLALLGRLSAGAPLSITTLSADSRLTRQAVTKHLHVLADAGLVAPLKAGRETRFSYRPEALDAARAYLDGVSAQWDDALERLRRFVEE